MSNRDYILKLPYQESSEVYFLKLRALENEAWLDSGLPHSHSGRFDILTAAPSEILNNPTTQQLEQCIEKLTSECPSALKNEEIPFAGGLIGYFNYEYNGNDFKLTPKGNERPSTFGVYHWALIQDHQRSDAFLVFTPGCSEELRSLVVETFQNDEAKPVETFNVENFAADLSQEKYLSQVAKIKHHITEGDCYQINFSQRFSGDFNGSTHSAYLTLRELMPNPFSAYINISDDTIVSLSPERFIKVLPNKHAITQPIKGTSPRGTTKKKDKALANELANSEKNQAENVMIVDLLRNDFSRSCEPFSVKVPSLFTLESFANVHHLVSTIEGQVCDHIPSLEFFMRCFPGGSITGTPKKRAMEIIQDLEEHPRNIYCGSICYFSANGNIDSNIAIRTALVSQEKIYCWGGGGIVADSTPLDEYQESLDKIQVLINALK